MIAAAVEVPIQNLFSVAVMPEVSTSDRGGSRRSIPVRSPETCDWCAQKLTPPSIRTPEGGNGWAASLRPQGLQDP